MHLCRAPLDRLAMRQQHFLPLLKSCSYPHLLLPQGSLARPSLGPQNLESGTVSPMARNTEMSPMLQVAPPYQSPWDMPRHQDSSGGQA